MAILRFLFLSMFSWSFLMFLLVGETSGSTGDRSQMFHNCLNSCLTANCSDESNNTDIPFHIPIHLKLLQWSCTDECKYSCMWPTVEWFVDAGIGVQQFYGKWPFIRLFGLQEPAAAFFSIMNLACHIVMFFEFRRKVPPEAPFYSISLVYFYVSKIKNQGNCR